MVDKLVSSSFKGRCATGRLLLALVVVFLTTSLGRAVPITLFVDTATFVDRAKDIVVAKCLGPVPDGAEFDDGLYPVDVQVVSILKGDKKPGKIKIATIYPMEAGKTYMLTSLGGSAFGTDFLAIPQMSVVELPPKLELVDLKGKKITEQVEIIFAGREKGTPP